MNQTGLLAKRVLIVTGKGGVGKTTVAASLAVAAVQHGLRVALCETQGSRRVPDLFDRPSQGYDLFEVHPDLFTMSITSEHAIEDYILQQIRVRALYKLAFKNRVMGPFMRAVPGLHDLVQLGKVWDLERRRTANKPAFDLLVVDAPATGHGLTMLESPQAMMDLTVAGPFHENAKLIRDLIEDPERTSIVLVSLPEEMPVNETLELYERLGRFRGQVVLSVLNEVHPTLVGHPEAWPVARAAMTDPALAEAVGFADRAARREAAQQIARERLHTGLPCPLVELPFLFHRDLRVGDLRQLAAILAPWLEASA